jgi:NAD(P)H-hydrate epimerase
VTDARTDLAELFRTASQAHHDAFVETDGADPDWPEWYSKYLALPLSHRLGTTLPPDMIAVALRTVEKEMRGLAPGSEWTEYYAHWFLARYAIRVDLEAAGHKPAP